MSVLRVDFLTLGMDRNTMQMILDKGQTMPREQSTEQCQLTGKSVFPTEEPIQK